MFIKYKNNPEKIYILSNMKVYLKIILKIWKNYWIILDLNMIIAYLIIVNI